ncbi:hypothetical protein Tsubulata_004883 [Turnera subulata]|uniref:SGNH hydrolase-type esterase domain-containing protein n=1 Tax=Turnera subulata TaxID=218843 RepID=A0A9Q0JGD0_9ROSI|nr:hypothetical protein Tsubulata_004883 [Turnera subulata]
MFNKHPKLEIISLGEQIDRFRRLRADIKAELGEEETKKLLSKAVFIFSVGGNDFFAYLKSGGLAGNGTLDFLLDLTSYYGNYLLNLYDMDARKFGIVGLPPVGSCPYIHAHLSFGEEIFLNFMVEVFSLTIDQRLWDLRPIMPGMKYSLGNTYAIFNDVVNNPSSNFSDVRTACWNGEPGWTEGGQTCKNWKGTICSHRDEYLFFDGIHPTQKAAGLAAEALYSGRGTYVRPINFRDLASSGTDPTQKAAAEFVLQDQHEGILRYKEKKYRTRNYLAGIIFFSSMEKIRNSCTSLLLLLGFCMLPIILAQSNSRPIPAIFIFGDSFSDVGTNNYLDGAKARADFRYNGIDYPKSIPTGRFSNGYNIADQIAMLFGYKQSPPPFLYLVNQTNFQTSIAQGVNFASAGAGILDETGEEWGNVVTLRQQIQQFQWVRDNITEAYPAEEATKIISESLYIFYIGSNDLLDHKRTNSSLSKEQLMAKIQFTYYNHLKNLYSMGARKFAVSGTPPIGCCPFARALKKKEGGGDGCYGELNDFALAFRSTLESLLQKLSIEIPNMLYSLGNAYSMGEAVFRNYPDYGNLMLIN